MGDRGRNRVEDKSQDRAYYALTPHLVLAACENPYQLALWTVIKMITGEDGQCTLSTADLAALAMMSTGRCQKAREALLRLGLIEGRLYRDEGYPCAVWHLRIPNLWPANIDWRERHHSLRGRIALKRAQRKGESASPRPAGPRPAGVQSNPCSEETQDLPGEADEPHEHAPLCGKDQPSPGKRDHSQSERGRSPGERTRSPDERTRSPDERTRSPDERTRSPGEPKKILKEEPQEGLKGEPKGSGGLSPEKIWHSALTELEMQMTRATFARWVRPLEFVGLERREAGALAATVWCPNEYVRGWCAERLDVRFRQALGGIAEEKVEMVYVVDDT